MKKTVFTQYDLNSTPQIQFEITELSRLFAESGSHPYEAHIHSFYQIIWFRQGTGRHYVDFKEYPVTDNTMFFISPGQIHYFEDNRQVKGIVIHFNESFLSDEGSSENVFLKYNMFNAFDAAPYYHIHQEDADKLAFLVREMAEETCNEKQFAHKDLLKYLIKIMLIYVQRTGERGHGLPLCINNAANRTFVRFRQMLEHHYRSMHTVKEYANHLRLQTVEAYVEPSLNLKREYWDVQLRVPLAWQFALLEMRLPQSLSQRTHRLMPTPSLQVKHRLSAMWEINLSSSLTFIKPEIQQLYAGYLFRSYRSAQAYDPQLSYDKAWQSRVMLRFNNPLRGLFLSLSGFATRLWRETLYQYENREGYLSVGHVLHRPHTGLSAGASVRLSKAFDWKRLYVALSGSYLRNHNKLMLEEEWAESRMSTASVSAQVTMEPARFLNFEGNTRASLRRSELVRANALPASTAWSYEHSLDVNVVFSKAWQWQLRNRVTHDNRNREATYFMDASLSYTRERWTLRLEGHNLLNRTRVSAIYLSDYTRQLAVNDLRPLEVLLKVNFSF